jgi:hypothetical protein
MKQKNSKLLILAATAFVSFTSLKYDDDAPTVKMEMQTAAGGIITEWDYNTQEVAKEKVKVKLWMPKSAVKYDMIYIHLEEQEEDKDHLRVDPFDDHYSAAHFTQKEVEAELTDKEFISFKISPNWFKLKKDRQDHFTIYGRMIESYEEKVEGNGIVKKPVYGKGRVIGRSESFNLVAKVKK